MRREVVAARGFVYMPDTVINEREKKSKVHKRNPHYVRPVFQSGQ